MKNTQKDQQQGAGAQPNQQTQGRQPQQDAKKSDSGLSSKSDQKRNTEDSTRKQAGKEEKQPKK